MSFAVIVTDAYYEIYRTGPECRKMRCHLASRSPRSTVPIQTTVMGSAFGRRYKWEFVTLAVLIAEAVRPASDTPPVIRRRCSEWETSYDGRGCSEHRAPVGTSLRDGRCARQSVQHSARTRDSSRFFSGRSALE